MTLCQVAIRLDRNHINRNAFFTVLMRAVHKIYISSEFCLYYLKIMTVSAILIQSACYDSNITGEPQIRDYLKFNPQPFGKCGSVDLMKSPNFFFIEVTTLLLN